MEKWLTHSPLKATFTGSNPVRVTMSHMKSRQIAGFFCCSCLIHRLSRSVMAVTDGQSQPITLTGIVIFGMMKCIRIKKEGFNMKTAVLTDSAANLSKTYIEDHDNLFIVPLRIMVDETSYRDQIDIDPSDVYAKLDSSRVTTSLPANEDLTEALSDIKAEGYTHLIVINISSGLSGTYNMFRLLLKEEETLDVIHYDSKTLAAEQGFLVERAVELIEEGTPWDRITGELDRTRNEDTIAFYTINTLKYLRRGGRIGKVEGTLGDMLHIKPIITVNEDGVYVTLSKAFGMKRSLIKMKKILTEKYGKEAIDVVIHYGNNETLAEEMAGKLERALNIRHVSLIRLTPVLGVHTGPEIIAYVARRV